MVTAAALIVAMLVAPVVHRITVELSCHIGGAVPGALGRLHAPALPECGDAGRFGAGASRRAGP